MTQKSYYIIEKPPLFLSLFSKFKNLNFSLLFLSPFLSQFFMNKEKICVFIVPKNSTSELDLRMKTSGECIQPS
ncbi:hypothetical protein LINPERHAP1_LOCUS28410 [Linum perenne]